MAVRKKRKKDDIFTVYNNEKLPEIWRDQVREVMQYVWNEALERELVKLGEITQTLLEKQYHQAKELEHLHEYVKEIMQPTQAGQLQ